MKLLAPFLKTAKSGAQTRWMLFSEQHMICGVLSIHCAIEDLDKVESGGYFADCAKTDKAPQVIPEKHCGQCKIFVSHVLLDNIVHFCLNFKCISG